MKIQLCSVGNSFKRKTTISFMRLIEYAYLHHWFIGIHFAECADIVKGRDWCLDGTWDCPKTMKPFKGEHYDYILWCDSDQVFDPDMVQDLIDADKDVISACIKDAGGLYCQGIWPEDEEAKLRGDCLRITDETISKFRDPIEIDYCGFGFVLIKRGVYEALDFSWHQQIPYGYPNVGGMMSEDGSWCKRIKEKGFKIWVHPRVKVNHIKEHEL